jgi:site-specific DNA-adenine methylase
MSKLDNIPLGCFGNKRNELKSLLPIIEPEITDKTIFVEPFCGSCIVSFNVFKKINKDIEFHINDIDPLRIQFYKNMLDEDKRNDLYKIEQEIEEKGQEHYYSIVNSKDDDYLKYVISRRIYFLRYGLFPTTKSITLKTISNNWINFFKHSKITNKDYKQIIDEYRENENAFIYLDPPYVDSFNTGYVGYQKGHYDEELKVIDNTKIYIDLLDILSCKCKVLFSINENAITKYLYRDYIKETYNHKYSLGKIATTKINKTRCKNSNVLIITNF